MFPDLQPWQPPGDTEAKKLGALRDIAVKFTDESARPENPTIPAGYTYFGQFITHDLTFNVRSELNHPNDPDALLNLRTPRFDLDCLYGRGRTDQPYLYTQVGSPRSECREFLLGTNSAGEWDLPRNRDDSLDDASSGVVLNYRRTPLIGDPRNDENLILGQLHLQFLRFHNRWAKAKEREGENRSFAEAQRLTRWHYQWLALYDYLPRLCGRDLVDEVLAGALRDSWGARLGRAGQPFIPVEFAAAAFRVGHCMVRDRYHLNADLTHRRGDSGPLWIFSDPIDVSNGLQGGRELPQGWSIQWDHFVDGGREKPQPSMKIGPRLAEPLASLPFGERDPWYNSLAFRTLLRGWRLGLPSGQDVACRLGVSPIDAGDDPLWLYVVREAAGTGGTLGPVGARIVAEVFIGLLRADPGSFLSAAPRWKPEKAVFGGADPQDSRLIDFLRFARAPIDATEWGKEQEKASGRRARATQRGRGRPGVTGAA